MSDKTNEPGLTARPRPYRSPLATGLTEKKSDNWFVSLRFGHKTWFLKFEPAVDMIRNYIKAEHKACKYLVNKINKDFWITSYFSELFGTTKPPDDRDWIYPINLLRSARSMYHTGDFSRAQRYLERARDQYDAVHKKWIEYRYGLEKGAERAITGMEITIVVVGAYATAGYGASLAARGATRVLLKGATMSAGLSGYKTTAEQVGLVSYGVEKKLDVGKIVLDSVTAFLTSLIGGKLSDKFLGLMTPRVTEAMAYNNELFDAAAKAGAIRVGSNKLPKELLADFLGGFGTNALGEAVKTAATKAKGKNMTMEELMKLVVVEFFKENWATAMKAYFATKC